MNRPQIRNLKEWTTWCFIKGTSGDQVFDILEDWEIEDFQYKAQIKELEQVEQKLSKECYREHNENKQLQSRVKELKSQLKKAGKIIKENCLDRCKYGYDLCDAKICSAYEFLSQFDNPKPTESDIEQRRREK